MKKLAYTLAVTGVALSLAAPAFAANYDDNTAGGTSTTREAGTVALNSGQITNLQQRLSSEGFSPGIVDGVLGPRTRAALRRYQESNDLAITGTATDETMTQLGVSTSSDVDVDANVRTESRSDSNADMNMDTDVDSDNNSDTYR